MIFSGPRLMAKWCRRAESYCRSSGPGARWWSVVGWSVVGKSPARRFGLRPKAGAGLAERHPVLTTEPVDSHDGGLELPAHRPRQQGEGGESGEGKCERKDPEHEWTLPVERAAHLRGELLEPVVPGQEQMEVEEVVRCERRPDAGLPQLGR